ncbi:MAG: prepilin-type N-terminal cleavage/methylation domain-containing protein [Variibacter sp.]|nr:prepilin-type N-terminal cleavage/methylation domain-containing protein [Variibacter sp.]
MDRKVAPEPRPTSSAAHAEASVSPRRHASRQGAALRLASSSVSPRGSRRAQAGFTLVEIICVVAILMLVAAIALPTVPRGTSRPRLEGYALEAAALLKADRAAAIRRRAEVATVVDAPRRLVRSGASGRTVRLPADVTFDAMLAARCNSRPSDGTIRYFASGMSCGGVIALTREGVGYEVRVNWLTGGVEVVAIN